MKRGSFACSALGTRILRQPNQNQGPSQDPQNSLANDCIPCRLSLKFMCSKRHRPILSLPLPSPTPLQAHAHDTQTILLLDEVGLAEHSPNQRILFHLNPEGM